MRKRESWGGNLADFIIVESHNLRKVSLSTLGKTALFGLLTQLVNRVEGFSLSFIIVDGQNQRRTNRTM